MKKLIISLFLIFAFPIIAFASNLSVSPSGSGSKDGSDWNNCMDWSTISFVRGNVYYLVDGDTYATKTMNTAESSTTYITIKKATGTNYTDVSATGWVSTMGDGQSKFLTTLGTFEVGSKFRTGYWVFDGVTGSGSDSSSYGFIIQSTNTDRDAYIFGIPGLGDGAYQIDHITVSHLAIIGAGEGAGLYGQYGVYSNPTTASTNIEFSYCYFYNCSTNFKMHNHVGTLLHDCYFAGNWSSASEHGQQVVGGKTSGFQIYNCIFKDSEIFVTGMHNDTSGVAGGNTGMKVFNNLVIGNVGSIFAGFATAESGEYDCTTSAEFYENTFVGCTFSTKGAIFVGLLSDVESYKSIAYNNLFYDCYNPEVNNITSGSAGGIDHDYNAYYNCTETYEGEDAHAVDVASTDPFTNSEGGDYTLGVNGSAAVDAGYTLGSPYNIDYAGTSRPQGSAYDIGAYESISGSISGTITADDRTESEMVVGGTTLIVDIYGDTLINPFTNDIKNAIVANLNASSSQNDTDWSSLVEGDVDSWSATGVVRTDDNTYTITFPDFDGDPHTAYEITETEYINDIDVPASALTGGIAIEATGSFTIAAEQISSETIGMIYSVTGPTVTYSATTGITISP